MGIEVDVALPGQVEPDVLAFAVVDSDNGGGFSEPSRILDERLGGRLSRLREEGELSGRAGRTLLLHLNGELNARRVAAAGVGARDEVDADALRTAAAAVAPELSLAAAEQARAVVEGVVLGSYDPGQWRSSDDGRKEISRVVICAEPDD